MAQRLKNKFKNGRKRSSSPTVLNQRRGAKPKLAPDMPGYQPPVKNCAVEDQRSINVMKTDADEDTVKKLMLSTFPIRRQDVIKGTTVSKLKKLYPRLFTLEQVSPESYHLLEPITALKHTTVGM